MWTIITRHPNHPKGKWQHDSPVYETREQAIAAAKDQWDGTVVQWSLMSIPVDDDPELNRELERAAILRGAGEVAAAKMRGRSEATVLVEARRLLTELVVGYDQGGREINERFVERARALIGWDRR